MLAAGVLAAFALTTRRAAASATPAGPRGDVSIPYIEQVTSDGRVIQRTDTPDLTTATVGQLVWTQADVLALVGRVNARYAAVHEAVRLVPDGEGDPLGPSWRAQWRAQLASWIAFSRDVRDDWISWGSKASTAQAFNAELTQLARTFEERTGRRLDLVSDAVANNQGGPGLANAAAAAGSSLTGLALLGVAGLALVVVMRAR